VPEQIFLGTIKGLLSFVINLSLLDASLIITIVLLVHANPSTRQKAVVVLSFLLLVFGLEVSLVNVYALLCSWLSPSTTLEPLTVVIMGILNGVTPVITDSILLLHIVIDRLEHSKSPIRLAVTMAPPILLKFGRLANTAMYIVACAGFVLSSVMNKSGDGVPNTADILDAAQKRSMEIASALQAVDNSYQLVMYYLNAFQQRRRAMKGLIGSTKSTSTTPTGLIRILLASGGNFLLPIVLSTAQLAISRQWPDSDIPQNLDQVKVIVNVVGASVTSLVAALNRWHLSRITGMLAAAEAEAIAAMTRHVIVDATETTALLGCQSGAHLKRKTSKARQIGVKFDAELMNDNIDLADDQTQGFATSLPITYPSGSFPDADSTSRV